MAIHDRIIMYRTKLDVLWKDYRTAMEKVMRDERSARGRGEGIVYHFDSAVSEVWRALAATFNELEDTNATLGEWTVNERLNTTDKG